MEKILEDLHKSLITLLKEFHRICCEQNFSYIVTGGTCLGAIRHQGFIPWDDDADVCLPREDYKLFVDYCLNGGLNKGFTLQVYGKKEPHYSCPFVRLRLDKTLCVIPYHEKAGWKHLGIFIDIFPYDETSTLETNKIEQIKKKYFRNERLITNKLSFQRKTFKSKLLHFALFVVPISFLFKRQESIISLLKRISGGTQKAYIDLNTPYSLDRSIFPLPLFSNRILKKFEDIELFVPKDYDAFLTIMYGNYMEIPPVEKRVSHLPDIIKIL